MSILAVAHLSKSFGSLKVIDNLSFEAPAGQALGIIGPNGAGKTTLFNLITGTLKPDAGNIWFDSREVTADPPAARCRAGMCRSFQIPHPFGKLTVFENLLVAATHARRQSEREAAVYCAEILERTGLVRVADRLGGSLTLLDRKRLELARALAAQPKLILLDEIAGGLTEAECNVLVELAFDIKRSGVTIVWIEHVVHALVAVADRLLVLNFGRLIADGDPREVMGSNEVREIYMGLAA
jgi:branched-chain amino acid transport system ATP-binding protein